MINPFPIFNKHFTIVDQQHVDQRISPNFQCMLDLTEDLSDFVVFYNGPKCGASAPDHFHFQAGNRGFLPIENDFLERKYTRLSANYKGADVFEWKDYHRGIISLKGSDKGIIFELFELFYRHLSELQPVEVEPMLNILAYMEDGDMIMHIFPRVLHRPSCYFADGDDNVMLSPASVDMGNAFVIAREQDFNKLTAVHIENILKEVCLSEDPLHSIISACL